jgi:hypothetical protein
VTVFRAPKFHPLPDVVHDFLPDISQIYVGTTQVPGRVISDFFVVFLVAVTLYFILTHPMRVIILKRFVVVYGCLALARGLVVALTTLPDAFPSCHVISNGTQSYRDINYRLVLMKTLQLITFFHGDSNSHPQLAPHTDNCHGDMIYSGHTVILTLCCLCWHTYYPRTDGSAPNPVKLLIWFVGILGVLSVVSSRFHYTIDVILGAYFALAVWSTYHRLAHDVRVKQEFVTIAWVDGWLIYPLLRWLERDARGLTAEDVDRAQSALNLVKNVRHRLSDASPRSPASPNTPSTLRIGTRQFSPVTHGIESPPPTQLIAGDDLVPPWLQT